MTILLTGATGYVGGRLLRRFEEQGLTVRCLVRDADRLRTRVAKTTEVVEGDVLDPATLDAPMRGIDVAYYLVHAMDAGTAFVERDRKSAGHFAAAAAAAGVRRIIYLGGLGDTSEGPLSTHLASRQEVGTILRGGTVPTVEFRASIVLGSGSLSFEMIRALTERLPVMICPRWVQVMAQPIAIEDLLDYLVAARDIDCQGSRVFEIGGTDVVSYEDLMREYARQRGLRRFLIRVPVLTPRLSSLWLGLVTPLYARVGRILIDSLRHPTVVTDPSAAAIFDIRPKGMAAAMSAALRNEDRECALTRWNDARVVAGLPRDFTGVRFGNRIVDSRTMTVAVPPAAAFAPIRTIGGNNGWYAADWMWRLRGTLDVLVGGIGLRRGRRDPQRIAVGEVLDWWRVEAFEPDRLLRLRAEMKLPGRAWLEFTVEPSVDGRSATIRQTGIFDPVGIAGLAYWYLLYPAHALIFRNMLRAIARRAVAVSAQHAVTVSPDQ